MPTRNVSPQLIAAIAAEASTLAACIRITPQGRSALGLTTHDEDITVAGLTYLADPGLSATEFVAALGFAVDNLEISGPLDDTLITRTDILGGVYDDAAYEIFALDYEHLDYGVMKLQRGTTGIADCIDEAWTFELRSLTQKLQQTVGEVTKPTCRARFGDVRCKIDLENGTHPTLGIPYKFAARQVLAGVSRLRFTTTISGSAVPAGYFEAGELRWTSGDNAGQKTEVKTHTVDGTTHTITVQDPPRRPISANDEFTVYKGCKKRLEDCFDVENVLNRRAEDYLPGLEETLKRP